MNKKPIFLVIILILSITNIESITLGEGNNTDNSYVIITTNAIKSSSIKLNDFILHKEKLGFNVIVVTEDDFNHLTGPFPDKRPDKIRQWLIDNYQELGIEYVLLIGDPTPDTKDGEQILKNNTLYSIPMKTFRDYMQFPGLVLFESPSDYYYADLDSDWNRLTKNYCGDSIDYMLRGINADPEVFVGRIPTYNNTIDGLDDILQKIIDYENEKDTTWRKSGLFAASFSSIIYDDALVWEQVINDFVKPDFTIWRQYMQGSYNPLLDSKYNSEEELRNSTLVYRLQNDSFGIVAIAAHGSKNRTVVGISLFDYDGYFITSEQTQTLSNERPSIFFIKSCTTGYPEDFSLGYSLLKNGGIAVICATRVIWYNLKMNMKIDIGDSATFYRIIGNTLQNMSLGKALYKAKDTIDNMILFKFLSYKHFMNLLRINLYGDPSIHLTY